MSNGAPMPDDKVSVKNEAPSSERITELARRFEEEFETAAEFLVRVPGRVNLIGEHVDYCGYPVLPMALEQDILVAAARAPDRRLALRNVAERYVRFDCLLTTHEHIQITSAPDGKPYWYNYVLCGIKGAMEYLDNKLEGGVRLYVDGNIPPASGLSSSSALVSSACLSFLYAQGIVMEKKSIALLCARSERHIGTQGGGMDQAIAFLAKRGEAQYISWEPLLATPVPLPEGAAFVVAHSLAQANKAATNHFNQRVIECRLAAAVLAKRTDVTLKTAIITLSEVQKALGKKLEEMPNLVKQFIPLDVYSRENVCKVLGITNEQLNRDYLTGDTVQVGEFKLRQRATHVFEEALRVETFRAICTATCGGGGGERPDTLELSSLGAVMRSSHASLETLYECSHPSLDRLVRLSDKAGVHARLTGAGWGGCIVALCPNSELHRYIELLKQEFYSHLEEKDQFVFATKPNEGAEIYVISNQ